jgi:hypothetical protein
MGSCEMSPEIFFMCQNVPEFSRRQLSLAVSQKQTKQTCTTKHDKLCVLYASSGKHKKAVH